MARVTINVTKTDIRKGNQGDASSCAIARAVGRLVRKGVEIDVTGEGIGLYEYTDTTDDSASVKLSRKAGAFIGNFDDDRSSVQPLSLKAQIPQRFLRPSVLKSLGISTKSKKSSKKSS